MSHIKIIVSKVWIGNKAVHGIETLSVKELEELLELARKEVNTYVEFNSGYQTKTGIPSQTKMFKILKTIHDDIEKMIAKRKLPRTGYAIPNA